MDVTEKFNKYVEAHKQEFHKIFQNGMKKVEELSGRSAIETAVDYLENPDLYYNERR